MENYKDKQYLIIVPTINLVEQFYTDLISYGMDGNLIGRVYSEISEPDKPIVISTWQSLQNNMDWMDRFFTVVVDECHITEKGVQITKILKAAVNAVYRFGVTGTLPSEKLELSNVKSYLGPVTKNYSAKELGDAGFISRVHIDLYNLQYQQEFQGEYWEIREKVFQTPARMSFIKKTIEGIGDNNILILVSLVEKEGVPLQEYLQKQFPDREVTFIYGDTKVGEREHHRQEFNDKNNKIVVATYPIFKLGVNVPSLKYIMLASPLKSKISVLQSIGRVLRLHASKIDGAFVIDIVDQVPYLWGHGEQRIKYYKKEKFEIEEKIVSLGT
jgi:superfamily II DNA or RNA helicase